MWKYFSSKIHRKWAGMHVSFDTAEFGELCGDLCGVVLLLLILGWWGQCWYLSHLAKVTMGVSEDKDGNRHMEFNCELCGGLCGLVLLLLILGWWGQCWYLSHLAHVTTCVYLKTRTTGTWILIKTLVPVSVLSAFIISPWTNNTIHTALWLYTCCIFLNKSQLIQ